MSDNPFSLAARARKALDLIAEIERQVFEQKFSEGPVALAAALESLSADQWSDIAKRAGVPAPSEDTIQIVVEHFYRRLTPLDRASMHLAEGGASGSWGRR